MESEKKEEKGSSSTSSSPSHEFSFTISLHSESSTPEKKRQNNPPLAIDLTPADEIFFHGHLLPLHFLSHLHAASVSSPRHSTNSMDSFTLPIRDMLRNEDDDNVYNNNNNNNNNKTTKDDDDDDDDECNHNEIGNFEAKGRKHFSLFGLSKWRKGGSESNNKQQEKRKVLKFDVSQFVKRYVKMVKPLLTSSSSSSKGNSGSGRRESLRFRRQTYSFSGGAVSPRERRDIRGRNGEFSAPASMRASPTNSGLLLATAGVPTPSSDSTMEELHAAIQAAIAHCKNSIASDNNNSPNLSISSC